jgi:hypothetical protein
MTTQYQGCQDLFLVVPYQSVHSDENFEVPHQVGVEVMAPGDDGACHDFLRVADQTCKDNTTLLRRNITERLTSTMKSKHKEHLKRDKSFSFQTTLIILYSV